MRKTSKRGEIAKTARQRLLAKSFILEAYRSSMGEVIFHYPSSEFWYNVSFALGCVVFAALAAGLTMGLVSLDVYQLNVLLETSPNSEYTEEERKTLLETQKYAKRVMPVLKRHHLLLVTLLLVNSAANEALPLFLDKVVSPYVAIILSVTAVLIFGEILPSAVFTGPQQLRYASYFVLPIRGLMFLLSPIAFPIAWLLDYCLGHGELGHRKKRSELKAIVKLQEKSHLSRDEACIINGTLTMFGLKSEDIMLTLDKVFMLSIQSILDEDTMATMIASGHSRVPVYEGDKHNIRGILLVKNLIVVSPEDKRAIKSLGLRKPLLVHEGMPLLDLLNEFQKGKGHLALITNRPDLVTKAWASNEPVPPHVHMSGIVTLEDVLEALIQERILDESDRGVRYKLQQTANLSRRAQRLKQIVAEDAGSDATASPHGGSPLLAATAAGDSTLPVLMSPDKRLQVGGIFARANLMHKGHKGGGGGAGGGGHSLGSSPLLGKARASESYGSVDH